MGNELDTTPTAKALPTLDRLDTQDTSMSRRSSWQWLIALLACDLFAVTLVAGFSAVLCFHDYADSGPNWPDSPRYANAAAMVHDWVVSGELTSPMAFAERNYIQYPAFSVPYHPPGVPLMMGAVFLVTGVSYFAARVFTAVCLAVSGLLLMAIVRRLSLSHWAGLAVALLYMTTPEITHWSRDTMSEIPAFMWMFAATWSFLAWLDHDKPRFVWLAFVLALAAFMCRVTTVGFMPAWILLILFRKQCRSLASPHLWVSGIVYLVAVGGYVSFAARFARYETSASGFGLLPGNMEFLSYFAEQTWFWGITWAAGAGLILLLATRRFDHAAQLGVAFFLSNALFKIALSTSLEVRHFLGIFPGMAILAVVPWLAFSRNQLGRGAAIAVFGLALGFNLVRIPDLPAGIRGYDQVALGLSQQTEPGNVLTACWYDQELMFRYRSLGQSERQLIRCDRSLAIRLSDYADVDPKQIATTPADVLDIVRQGRVRYVLTCSPSMPWEDRPADLALAETTMRELDKEFTLVKEWPIHLQFSANDRQATVHLWRYTGELLEGPSTIPVRVPTANLDLYPTKTRVDE